MTTGSYKTKQREVLLNYLKNNRDKHLTVEDMVENFKDEVGQTTIYRNLNMLVEEGFVRKYIVGIGEPACFQYIENTEECETHYHLKCNECGNIAHVDCHILEDVGKYLKEKYRFKVDNSKLILYGTCNECGVFT